MEKNSAAPDVQFKGSNSATATLVVPYVEFVLTEVLKNALQVGASACVVQHAPAGVGIVQNRCSSGFPGGHTKILYTKQQRFTPWKPQASM